MKTLNERFEAETGCASWINSDIYPDGKIHTRQYVEWLEAESQKSAIPCVSDQRELLFALLEWIDYGDGEDRENIVDRFLKDFEANNCA